MERVTSARSFLVESAVTEQLNRQAPMKLQHDKPGSVRSFAGMRHAPTPKWLHAPLAVLIMLSGPAGAAENPMRGFLKCLEMRDDQARLACYDRLAAALVELGPGAVLPPVGTDTSRAAAPPATEAAPQSAAPAAPAGPEDAFGNEMNRQDGAVDSITAYVVGGFTGWERGTVFRLDNGQAWEVQGSARFAYGGPDRPVTIRRAAFGSFMLSPDDLNRSVRVRRIE